MFRFHNTKCVSDPLVTAHLLVLPLQPIVKPPRTASRSLARAEPFGVWIYMLVIQFTYSQRFLIWIGLLQERKSQWPWELVANPKNSFWNSFAFYYITDNMFFPCPSTPQHPPKTVLSHWISNSTYGLQKRYIPCVSNGFILSPSENYCASPTKV